MSEEDARKMIDRLTYAEKLLLLEFLLNVNEEEKAG